MRAGPALPSDASDDVAGVLAALGQPALVAAEAGLPWPERIRARQSLRIRIIVAVVVAVCLAAGTLTFWEVQPSLFFNGSYGWWYPVDSARAVTTEAAGATQDTVPLRPGQLQGFAVLKPWARRREATC
jgi:hypothetical protein